MFKRYVITALIGWLIGGPAWAQDPQFTQFYAAPLYLNPAFAGSALAPRITVNYRNQWPAITNYVTSLVGIDHYVPSLKSGIGLMLVNDSQGEGTIRSTEIHALYSYQFQLSEQTSVRLGVQGGYVNRNLNYFGLTFGDQYNNAGFTGQPSRDKVLGQTSPINNYLDFSTGGLVYSDWYWAGASVHHLNQPEQAFFQSGTGSRLPMKLSVQAGLRIPLGGITGLGDEFDKEISFSPVVLYKSQGKYDQLDLGAYLTYSPLTLGVYYRGLPFKKYQQSLNNHDALAVLVGYRQDRFSVGYSYDATVSTLGFASGGSHEISLSYLFERPEPRSKRDKRRSPQLACPKF
jgi:type IX secretion system PorP/SprF family membrane protein